MRRCASARPARTELFKFLYLARVSSRATTGGLPVRDATRAWASGALSEIQSRPPGKRDDHANLLAVWAYESSGVQSERPARPRSRRKKQAAIGPKPCGTFGSTAALPPITPWCLVCLKMRTSLTYADPHGHLVESCRVGGKEGCFGEHRAHSTAVRPPSPRGHEQPCRSR